jgi:molybdate transport system ATP-binding protein
VTELAADFRKELPGGASIAASLSLPADGFSVTALFGPSGAGKTTILRCLAGLERPDAGSIRFGGDTWFDSRTGVHRGPAERRLGFLSQDYALFPHLTVEANVGYGLARRARSEREARVRAVLERFDLEIVAGRRPGRISGGEQQRTALARALVTEPRLLLLDEPLSALDAPLRERLRPELRRLLSGFSAPVLLVTHDRLDAIALADRVLIVDAGEIRQAGSVDEVFNRPADARVAGIVGVETVREGRILWFEGGLATVEVGRAMLTALVPPETRRDVIVCIRAEDVVLERGAPEATSVRNCLPARVEAVVPVGPTVRVLLDVGFPLTALVTRAASDELWLQVGDELTALVKAPAVHLVERGPRPPLG